MRLLISLLLLFAALPSHAQVITIGARPAELEVLKARKLVSDAGEDRGTLTVGSQYTTSELAAAKKTLEDAAPKKLAIKVGEFEVVEPSQTVTVPLLWVVTDDTLLQRVTIPANTPFSIWMTRRGDAGPKFHQFKSQPFDWVILVGVKNGFTAIQIVRNGETAKEPPYIVDRIDATVGEPAPPTPPPPGPGPAPDEANILVKAARADIKAGKGTADTVQDYAGLLATASNQITAGQQFATVGDYHKSLAAAAKTLLGDPLTVLPTLREEVAKRLDASIGTNPAAIFNDKRGTIAKELAAIAKILEGVK